MKNFAKKIKKQHAIEIFIYLCVGGCAWVVQTLMYVLLMHLDVYPSVAMIAGNFAGFIVSYFGHVRFTFKKTHRFSHAEFIKFLATSGLGLLINVAGVRIITKALHLHPGYAIIPTIFTPGITFLVSKFWAFR